MELTGLARSAFELATLAGVGVLALALLVRILSIPMASSPAARRRRLIEAGWTAVPLAMLTALAAAVAGAAPGA